MSQAGEARRHLGIVHTKEELCGAAAGTLVNGIVKVVAVGPNEHVECGSQLFFADRSILTLHDDGWQESYMPLSLPTVTPKGKRPWLTVSYWKQHARRLWWKILSVNRDFRLRAYRRGMRRSLIPALFNRDREEAVTERLNTAPTLSPLPRKERRVTKVSKPNDTVSATQSGEHASGADAAES